MSFAEHIRNHRKKSYSSVNEFLKETNLDISKPSYYAIEQGKYTPNPKDVYKIIEALKLNIRDTYILWLMDQLPEENLKSYFHISSEDVTAREEIKKYDPDEIITINKGYVDYLINNRLSRLLLAFIFINSSASLPLKYLEQEFKKHKPSDIKKSLNDLIDMGYIEEIEKNNYKANATYLYAPSRPDFEELLEANMIDIIKNSKYDELDTEYGKYSKGFRKFHRRTLTPDQLNMILDSFTHTFNNAQKLPSKAGQEYCMALAIGALHEK